MIPDHQKENQWFKDGLQLVEDNLARKPITHTAKNTILFLGDGMSITTITAARILAGQQMNQSGEEHVLSWEQFPWTALAKTYNVNQQVADSAGTATAFLCGVKTNSGKSGSPFKVYSPTLVSFPEPTCLLLLKFDTFLSKPNFAFPSFSSGY